MQIHVTDPFDHSVVDNKEVVDITQTPERALERVMYNKETGEYILLCDHQALVIKP